MTADHDLAALASSAYDIALKAGRLVLKKRNESLQIQGKKDGSPFTSADQAAEDLICAALEKLTPDYPVIAEERISQGHIPDIAGRPFWLVDPLDGTRNYIAGEAEFTVNVALVVENTPVVGIIHAPALEESFIGVPGLGATGVMKKKAVDISTRTPPPDGLVVLSSRYHGDAPELEAYLSNLPVRLSRRMGSALKFGLIARGEADLYPRFGRVMGWDIAAGHAIVAAAGGRVTTRDGQPIDYRTPDFAIGHFIARGGLNS